MDWAAEYNDPVHFAEDPIAFPTEFVRRGASLQDIETAAVFAAHFAWGRRAMIVRDLERFFDFLEWRPADYVMSGSYRCDETSCHRTIKWSETALICQNLREFYSREKSLESLSNGQIRTQIYGRKEDPGAADKKINLMRRWMVRRDGKVDLGLWKNSSPASLIIPLDTHVHAQALALGLTARSSKNLATALEITESFREIFPNDPCLGDFALFGYGVTNQ
ncbi:MAG: DUF2400 domain-containing protein [Bacteroidales bacterium]|nr:DUF2400 domain-containing protein [Bacteroidales bacterium]